MGKGSVQSLLGQMCKVAIAEIDPICALQACMAGLDVVTLESALEKTDIFCTATGNFGIITAEHMKKMKHNAIVCVDVRSAVHEHLVRHQVLPKVLFDRRHCIRGRSALINAAHRQPSEHKAEETNPARASHV